MTARTCPDSGGDEGARHTAGGCGGRPQHLALPRACSAPDRVCSGERDVNVYRTNRWTMAYQSSYVVYIYTRTSWSPGQEERSNAQLTVDSLTRTRRLLSMIALTLELSGSKMSLPRPLRVDVGDRRAAGADRRASGYSSELGLPRNGAKGREGTGTCQRNRAHPPTQDTTSHRRWGLPAGTAREEETRGTICIRGSICMSVMVHIYG
jgi:hypothetical protein